MKQTRTYGLTILTPPVVGPVTVAMARDNSQIDTGDHDNKLEHFIEAATRWIEEQTETSLITTSWRWTLDQFPRKRDWLTLPRWPVQSIEAVRYRDPTTGNWVTIPPESLVLRTNEGRSRVALADWASWPVARSTPDAVQIEFTAGFGEADSDVPAAWKQPILLLVGHWFENREAVIVGSVTEVPLGVQSLLETLRDPDDDEDFDLE